MKFPSILLFLFVTALNQISAFAQTLTKTPSTQVDTGDKHSNQSLIKLDSEATSTERLAWWNDARFGMFIHWGLYSQWGCHYPAPDGSLRDGLGEHMMLRLKIPRAEYAKIANVFNPTQFNADTWAGIAANAGMKYMVITSKHHDGFAMFNSISSDYNIVKRTPWKRDPVKELADACRKQGLKFGVYYSLGRDWDDANSPTEVKSDGWTRSNTWDFPDEKKKNFTLYYEGKVKPQVRELLELYHPDILWFDTPERISSKQSKELLSLIRSLAPQCIVNQRVGNRYGDYRVAEQEIPSGGWSDPWESCMTLNKHWGYYMGDEQFKTPQTVVRNLIDIVSKGGNLLLNVGPTGEGIIPNGSVTRLAIVGEWLKRNGVSIYGAKQSAIPAPVWGRITAKANDPQHKIYLHIFNWPKDGQLIVPGISKVNSAVLLNNSSVLSTSCDSEGLHIKVPRSEPDVLSSTIQLTL